MRYVYQGIECPGIITTIQIIIRKLRFNLQLELKFGRDSNIVELWMNSLGIKERKFSSEFKQKQLITQELKNSKSYLEYQEFIKTSVIDNFKIQNKNITQNYMQNYSFVEMIYYMTNQVAQAELDRMIEMVITAFLHDHSETIGFCKVKYLNNLLGNL